MTKAGMVRIPLDAEITRAMEAIEDGEQRNYIGASVVAGDCERALWYGFRWAMARTFHGRTLRRFETGHVYEARVIEWLRTAGYEVHCENPRARNEKKQFAARALGGLLAGHLDGFVRGGMLGDRWHLLEVKAMASAKYHYDPEDTGYTEPLGNRHPIEHPTAAGNEPDIEGRWWRIRRQGVRVAAREHFGQLQTYMGLSREDNGSGKPWHEAWGLPAPLDVALYVAVNTDTEQIHAELVEYSPAWWLRIRARALAIIRADQPPERVNPTDLFPPCKFCDYRTVCHRDAPLAVNCRTCRHASVLLPGDRGYFGTQAQWVCGLHKHGCGDYTACGDHSPIIERIEF